MLTTRPLTLADAEEICALVNRGHHADGLKQRLTSEELIQEWSSAGHALATRSSAVVAADGTIRGFVTVEHRPATAGQDEQTCHLDGAVDPVHRRHGHGGELLAWSVDVGSRLLRGIDDPLPKLLRLRAYDFVTDADGLARRAGFAAVRWFEELLRPLDADWIPGEPGGVRVERWPNGRDEELRAVRNEAFLDHWGSSQATTASWHQQLHGHAGRTDLSFIAVDEATDRPVALLVTGRYPEDDVVLGRRDGWIQTLATLRPWRGRGVGTALIGRALAAYVADGLTHASIGVDSANPSGAARLYRELGFTLQQRSVIYDRDVTSLR